MKRREDKGALLAPNSLPKSFPMLMTAAGTLPPAKVLVIGAGVAGLQAIATCRRLAAIVEAFDVRPAVKEQVESLGARFVQMQLHVDDAEDAAAQPDAAEGEGPTGPRRKRKRRRGKGGTDQETARGEQIEMPGLADAATALPAPVFPQPNCPPVPTGSPSPLWLPRPQPTP